LYSEEYLVRRPLLRAIAGTSGEGPVPILLIDEIDRADDEFEAYLLEILSDFTVTVPELGTFRAQRPPVVILTSNRTRDVHDALKRRCLYHWVDHPSFEREVAIVRLRVPEATELIAREVSAVVAELRRRGLYKPPGVAETIDWAQAISVLGATRLDERTVERTLGAVIKYREDAERVRAASLTDLVSGALKYGT
jgi:MoxR-like ATPase